MFRYLEDLTVGERIVTASTQLTQSDIVGFAADYDPQPMHVDPAWAASGPFGGIIASGWHTAAVVMRLIVDARPLGGTPVLGLGVDQLRWPKPVRPGDTIRVEMEVLAITPSRSKPDFGVVQLRNIAHDQNGEIVITMLTSLWVPRRPNVENDLSERERRDSTHK
jgi:acyl dehydratase